MTAGQVTEQTAAVRATGSMRERVAAPVRDGLAVAGRNLVGLVRVPQLLVFSTIQPLVFVLMFRYVFGGVIGRSIVSVPYVDYLMPGIFVQTAVFGAMNTAIGLATDMQTGLMERFRSLPMARSAVLSGRTLADLARNVFVVALMTAAGFAVGFRLHSSVVAFLAAVLLVVAFGFTMSWIFAVVGLWVGDPETAQAAAFPLLVPLVFASGAFIPVDTMPGWLQAFAQHQPVTRTAQAVRDLVLGAPAASDIWLALAWDAAIIAAFAPLGVWLYRRAV
ncbi:ABC transporter permease [Streptacidiphilus neutrinimicus]|uniref:ABC transporter permease n=1 Tax=Streptacidiphilus neutrinimicus TaxID=105420 RepID=UPI000A927962|nr:ABC transporter permease [Streptacidiphilus neutrinimicus]